MLTRRCLAPLAVLLWLALVPAAHALTITEVPTPVKGGDPLGLAVAPDGSVWYGAGKNIEGGAGRPHVGRIDPRTLRVQTFPLGAAAPPLWLVHGTGGTIWGIVNNAAAPNLVRIDATRRSVTEVGQQPGNAVTRLAVGAPGGRIFGLVERPIAGDQSEVVELDPVTGAPRVIARSRGVTLPVPPNVFLPGSPKTWTLYASYLGLAVTPGGIIWAVEALNVPGDNDDASNLAAVRIDPDTGATSRYDLPPSKFFGDQIVAGPGDEVWIMRGDANANSALYHVTAADGQVRQLPAPAEPLHFPVLAAGAVWGTDGGRLARLDPASGQVSYTTGLTPTAEIWGLAPGPDGVLWTRQSNSDNLLRISHGDAPSTANAETAMKRGLLAAASCSAACRGEATVEISQGQRGKGSAASPRGSRVLGRARFRMASPRQADIRVPIARGNRRLLTSRRTWRATVTVRTRSGGKQRISRKALVLRFYPPLRRSTP